MKVFYAHIKLFLFMLVVFLCDSSASTQYDLSFDQLFPETIFKNALDICMHIWADIKELNRCACDDRRYNDLQDLIVGRLVRLNKCIDTMIDQISEELPLMRSDLDYLVSIIDQIMYERVVTPATLKALINHSIADLIKTAREKMLVVL